MIKYSPGGQVYSERDGGGGGGGGKETKREREIINGREIMRGK